MQRFVFGGKLWKFNETFGLVGTFSGYKTAIFVFSFSCYDDYPHVAPFLAVEHFASFPVHPPTFIFSNAAVSNILSMEEIKSVLIRLDELISYVVFEFIVFLITMISEVTTCTIIPV